ncbi:MAG: B12-binding domain-containing radical SAM protein [Geobacteraceae bacterium]|nr:B12-binding domain-containing radical SAM protein [Geobacteraceae bacterium]
MRILLVNPPNCGRSIPEERYGIDSLKQIFRGEPLALQTLAGNLPDHDVRIVDLKAAPDTLDEALTTFTPDLVGFTAMTCEVNTVLALARRVRNTCSASIVVGGCHASCEPEDFNRAEIDWIVIGLGTVALRELVEALQDGRTPAVDGVANTSPTQKLRWRPRSYAGADAGSDTTPRYDLVEGYRSEYYLSSLGLQMGLVSSALGCPYACNFCCIPPITGKRYLTRSIPAVIADIETLDNTPVIRLVDANSFGNPKHALQLAEALASAGVKRQYLADVRSDTVVRHPELLQRWKDVGLRAVVIGFEAIDTPTLEVMNKNNSADRNRAAIEILHRLGITIVGDFIINPDYNEAQFDQVGAFAHEQGIELPMYSILTPLPGTELHRQMRPQIRIHDLDYYTLTNAVLPTRLDEELFYQRYAALLREGHRTAKV